MAGWSDASPVLQGGVSSAAAAVDLLGVDTDAAALRAGLKLMFGPPRPATGGYSS